MYIFHLRVPAVLDGADHRRYLERKLREFQVRLREPLKLYGTRIPVGYPIVRTAGKRNVVEARGTADPNFTVVQLQSHPLIEDAMEAEAEDARRAKLAAAIAAGAKARPADDAGDENITAGGPHLGPMMMGAMIVGAYLLLPLAYASTGVHRVRRWIVRDLL